MKNKFEALNTFQSWPEDWQRLCAEYWAENDKPTIDLRTVRTTQGIESARVESASRICEVSIQPVKPARRKATAQPWTVMEQEYLAKCANNCQTQIAACKMFLQKYPGRNIGAVQIRYYLMAKNNWKINY